MNEDWIYVTTTILSEEESRPSNVLRADGTPYYLERRKQRIGFDTRPSKST